MNEVKERVKMNFERVFDVKLILIVSKSNSRIGNKQFAMGKKSRSWGIIADCVLSIANWFY